MLTGCSTLRILSNARLPSLQGEKLIRELNFFPKESINIVHPNDVSTAPITPRIVEKRFKFPNFANPDVSTEDLGHHAGYYTIQHSHAARWFLELLFSSGVSYSWVTSALSMQGVQ
ncbi:Serine carboxypeptidase-like 49 [Camellia lanceoleosa]|uniref:Serine carboxypeptidase-like 49 n=1 Tax=Camellia lanceoleosa TaxID=1840588 RepID=A0ACC0FIQ3_9ERIC|nr:Serine carboxypeptidase-like 49 [Camellia lanceoleosa]